MSDRVGGRDGVGEAEARPRMAERESGRAGERGTHPDATLAGVAWDAAATSAADAAASGAPSPARPLPRSVGRGRGAFALHDSARRIRSLLRKELLQTFRDPRRRRMVLVAPILQLMLFGYAVTTDVHEVATVVVDHDATTASRELQDVVQAGGYFRIVQRSDRSADIARALDRGDATVALEIPRGFERDLAAGRGALVQVLVDGTNSNTATVAQGYLSRMVQQYGLSYAADRGASLPRGVELRPRAWYNPALLSRVYNVPAVTAVLLTLMCLLLTSLSVVHERELGTLEQLMVSPLSAAELILGKTVPVMLIALMDLVLVVTVALGWFRVPFVGSMTLLVLAAFIYILAALGLGLLISTVSKTQQEAFMGMFLVLMPMIILSGFMYPIRSMPVFFQRLTLLNPLRHFLEIVRAIFLKGAALPELWPQFLGITIFAVGLLSLSIWRFRNSIR